MMFCPKCGSLLKTKEEKGKTKQVCSCGYSKILKEDITISESIDNKKEDIEVVEENTQAYPIVEASCPKCNHDKAYYWLQQTRAGDEPETKFYRCQKCKHTWRDYS